MAKYQFPFQSGNASMGGISIMVLKGIAEIDDVTPEIERTIESLGGVLVEEKLKRKPRSKKKAGE